MKIQINKKIAYEKFMFLEEGQLFSIDDLYNEKDKTLKRYFIKINPITIPNELKPKDNTDIVNFGYGYAVDLESGDFTIIKLDKNVILENGYLMLED